ncbi:unnamed protein product [[Candida] boidinii]|nr:unnamed protein product [[Candida] boidinii]
MSSIYLPNPCLLGILFTVSTHDGHQLVFHYPSSTNNYGFKATPLPQQFMEFFNADGSESESDDEDDDDGLSLNNSDLELYTDDEDGRSSYTMGGSGSSRSNSFKFGMSGHDPASSSKNGGSSSFGNTVNYGNSSTNLTGKDYLDMQERIERKKRKKEEDRKNLMKRLLIQDTNNSNNNNNNNNSNNNQDTISGDRDGSTINDIINEVTSNNGSTNTNNTNTNNNNNTNDKQDGSTSLHNTLGTVNTERDREKLRKIFGFEEEFISEIVTPPKQLCNTRFDLSVDEMTFLGLPIHVQDDGNWKKTNNKYKHSNKNDKNDKTDNIASSKRSNKKNKKNNNINGSGSVTNKSEKSFRKGSLSNGEDGDNDDDEEDEDDEDEKDDLKNGKDDEELENGKKDSNENEEDCPMTLFHMVFVINPPVVEYNYRIDEMFYFIISRLSMILRHEQNKSNYIWEQVSQILEIKRENTDISVNELYSLLFEKSELARLIRDTYESVSRSEIANLKINGKLRSFQIPIKKEFSFLPPKEMPFLLGSTLSSVSPFLNLGYDNFDSFGDSETCTQFALILLDDPEMIIKDLNAEKNSPGETLIRIIKPTESLAKLSTLSGLPINEVVTFANHLVYWRRAKAIFPISPKNVYIISPIAPLSNLYRDSTEFSVKFPALPKLPEFLSIISTSTFKPKSLSSIIPSREHKELYLSANYKRY